MHSSAGHFDWLDWEQAECAARCLVPSRGAGGAQGSADAYSGRRQYSLASPFTRHMVVCRSDDSLRMERENRTGTAAPTEQPTVALRDGLRVRFRPLGCPLSEASERGAAAKHKKRKRRSSQDEQSQPQAAAAIVHETTPPQPTDPRSGLPANAAVADAHDGGVAGGGKDDGQAARKKKKKEKKEGKTEKTGKTEKKEKKEKKRRLSDQQA